MEFRVVGVPFEALKSNEHLSISNKHPYTYDILASEDGIRISVLLEGNFHKFVEVKTVDGQIVVETRDSGKVPDQVVLVSKKETDEQLCLE